MFKRFMIVYFAILIPAAAMAGWLGYTNYSIEEKINYDCMLSENTEDYPGCTPAVRAHNNALHADLREGIEMVGPFSYLVLWQTIGLVALAIGWMLYRVGRWIAKGSAG